MLKLRLDELFTPDIIVAFQRQWTASPEESLAQAEATIRMIVAPRDERERNIAQIVVGLVGLEPDAFAWLEALAHGNFKLRENVTYAIGRVGESPAKFIRRQRDRIDQLVGHYRTRESYAETANAYRDALRLIVATSLLKEMRTGVAAKAALGAGWPLMVAADRLAEAEKRELYWWGNDQALQEHLRAAVQNALNVHRAELADPFVPKNVPYQSKLPPSADPYRFFAAKNEAVLVSPQAQAAAASPSFNFLKDPVENDYVGMARLRAELFLPALKTNSEVLWSLAMRSERRRQARVKATGLDAPPSAALRLQTSIWEYVAAGGFLPVEFPPKYFHLFEEDVAWHFNDEDGWPGLARWRSRGFLNFAPSQTKVRALDMDWGMQGLGEA